MKGVVVGGGQMESLAHTRIHLHDQEDQTEKEPNKTGNKTKNCKNKGLTNFILHTLYTTR